MTLTQADNSTEVTVRLGEQVVIRLTEKPTTGFRWAVDHGDEAVVALRDSTYIRVAGAKLGGDGQRVWAFEAQHRGKPRQNILYTSAEINRLYGAPEVPRA